MNAWIDQVADALDYMEWIGSVASDWPSIEENVGLLASAARLVLEGEDIWWCETHADWSGEHLDDPPIFRCRWAQFILKGNPEKPCNIVGKRMIDIPEEETRDEKV